MLAKVYSGAIVGLEGVPVQVEVDVSRGLPSLKIVGLPNKAIEEAKERVRSAIKNTGADFPSRRITINLAPADLPKEGPAYDLPIALGILAASGQIEEDFSDSLVAGELSLDGGLRPTNGILSLAILAQKKGFKKLFIPAVNASEASVIGKIKIIPLGSLRSLLEHLLEVETIKPYPHTRFADLMEKELEYEFNFADVQGQEHAKRALEIAAAGSHNVFLEGPPGAGKTMLAQALASILPSLTKKEALEVTKIYSITGRLPAGQSLIKNRPFRSPHHTTSRIGLIGGGTHPAPGEVSLAHRGVLFLDEFPEFPRNVLEALRQPIEDGRVTISRAAGSARFPARFLLVAATNPCPCGYLGDPKHECKCTSAQIIRYQKRISGPIIDRIDLHVQVPAVKAKKLTGQEDFPENSETIRKRVQKARKRQLKRFQGRKLVSNAEMTNKQVKKFCPLDKPSLRLLRQAVSQLGLSARSFYKMIKVARTIADLAGEEKITSSHLAEALQYRPKKRETF